MINRLLSYRGRLLVVSIGIVYVWFGMLKFFPGVSPAESLAKETLEILTLGLVPSAISYFTLALWEVSIGLFLMLNIRKTWIVYLALVHILFTFTPLILLPALSFQDAAYTLTLVGQYIIKNLIIFSALLFVFPEKQTA